MTKYLNPDDENAFTGMPVLAEPHTKFASMVGYKVLCPLCKGHGGWRLQLDAYGPGEHFNAHCPQCNGWGWVKPGLDATCIHENGPARNIGRCYNEYACVKCGRKITIDSSD